jgi:hypothetical protein
MEQRRIALNRAGTGGDACGEDRMEQQVYKLWQGRWTEAWHALAAEEQRRLLGQAQKALDTAGGKQLVLCSAAWSNEQWPFFGLEEFPDIDAVHRHAQLLLDLNWGRYIESRTTVGTQLNLPE